MLRAAQNTAASNIRGISQIILNRIYVSLSRDYKTLIARKSVLRAEKHKNPSAAVPTPRVENPEPELITSKVKQEDSKYCLKCSILATANS